VRAHGGPARRAAAQGRPHCSVASRTDADVESGVITLEQAQQVTPDLARADVEDRLGDPALEREFRVHAHCLTTG
jgi:hypothetical protein